jgi:hypothetical protein
LSQIKDIVRHILIPGLALFSYKYGNPAAICRYRRTAKGVEYLPDVTADKNSQAAIQGVYLATRPYLLILKSGI